MFDPTEDLLADVFEGLINVHMGATPGPRTRKDVTDGTDLRVDFVYEAAEPDRLALEVTTMPNASLRAAHSAGEKWTSEIDEIVRAEELGSWTVYYSADTDIKGLVDEVLGTLRKLDSNPYRDPDRRFALVPTEDDGHGVIHAGVLGSVTHVIGFSEELLSVALDNAAKLKEARPRQTHLLVHPHLLWSRDPELTLVPPHSDDLPALAAIDWIWVVFSTSVQGMGERPWAWWAHPGQGEWNVQIGQL
jgi:hypothetical protein